MNLYFDPNVCIHYCPEHSENSRLILFSDVETFGPFYRFGELAFFKCAGIEKSTNKYSPCSFTTDCKNEFTLHVRKNHKYLKLICLYCSDLVNFKEVKFLKNAISLVIHIENSHQNLYFQCNSCPYRAITADHVNIHQATKHSSTPKLILFWPKPAQNAELTLKHFYDAHKAKYLQSDEYQCLYCDYLNQNFHVLILHLVKCHPDFPLMYYSPACSPNNDFEVPSSITVDKQLNLDDLLTDDEDLLTDDEDVRSDVGKNYCCFFCDHRSNSQDAIKNHLINHLFNNGQISKNKFFENWIDWFISSQYSFDADDPDQTFPRCPICIRLKFAQNNDKNPDRPIVPSIRQAMHYIRHSGYKPFQCLLCKQDNRGDFWLPDIFQCIRQHLTEFHRTHLDESKSLGSFNIIHSKRQDWNKIKDLLCKESILLEYSINNDNLFSSLNVAEKNALNLLETTYKKNHKVSY